MKLSLGIGGGCVAVLVVACGGIVADAGGGDGTGGGDTPGVVGGAGGAGGAAGGSGGASGGQGGSGNAGNSGGAGGGFGGTGGTGGSAGGTGGFGGTVGNCSGGDPEMCMWGYLDSLCDACKNCRCVKVCEGIAADPYAVQYAECIINCAYPPKPACKQACDSYYPGAAARNDAFFNCMDAKCFSECGGGPKQEDCPVSIEPAQCDDCFRKNCLQQCIDWIESPGAYEFFDCAFEAYTEADLAECCNFYPKACATFVAMEDCLDLHCLNSCL